MSFEKTLNDTDLRILTAAMYSLTADSESLGAVLLPENHPAALTLSGRLEAESNLRSEATKDSVPLVGVALGSIWVEAEVDGLPGCTWPVDEEGNTCSYGYDGPAWAPSGERVKVLAQGLDDDTCRWVLRGVEDNFGHPSFSALIRRRCAHLMAGGSIESYVEAT